MPPDARSGKGADGKKPPPPPSMKPMLLLLLFAPMFLWILLLPFASVIAAPFRPLLDPLAARSFQATIALLGLVSGLVSTLLRFRFTDWKKVRAFQERSQKVGMQLREAMKSQNKHLISKAREEQMELMREQQANMGEQFKPMLLLLVVSLPSFMWIYATVPPSGAAMAGSVAFIEGCPANVTVSLSLHPNGTLDLSLRNPDGSSNLTACGPLNPLHGPALQYIATHCPYRTGMGPFREHVERCERGLTGGPFRVPPLTPGDSGSRHPNDLALGLMPWWIVWYLLVSLPAGHIVQKAMEDRMQRKERGAAGASGGTAP